MGGGQRGGIEDLGRPRPGPAWPVIGPGLDEDDVNPSGSQPCGDHGSGRSATDHGDLGRSRCHRSATRAWPRTVPTSTSATLRSVGESSLGRRGEEKLMGRGYAPARAERSDSALPVRHQMAALAPGCSSSSGTRLAGSCRSLPMRRANTSADSSARSGSAEMVSAVRRSRSSTAGGSRPRARSPGPPRGGRSRSASRPRPDVTL